MAEHRTDSTPPTEGELLRITLASIGDGVICTDVTGRVTFLNGVAEHLTGWSLAEAAGRPLPDVFHIVNESTRRPVENPALRALAEGVVVGLANHTVLLARDGSERPIDDSAAPIGTADGRTVGAVLVFRDVTERKRAQAAVRVAEDRAEFARRVSGVGFWYCDLPFDQLQWDERVKDHFWLPPDAAVTIDTFYARIHPADREPTRRAIERSIGERTGYDVEYRTVHPVSGETKWVRAIGRTAYAADGSPTRFDGVTLDVTDRRRADDERRRLAAIVESSADAVISKSLDGVIRTWNPAAERMFGYTAAEAVGQPVTVIIPPDRLAEEDDILARLRRGDRVDHFDTVRVAKDGRRLDVSLSVSPVWSADGRLAGATKVARDVTDRLRAERAVEAAARRLQEFADTAPAMLWVAEADGSCSFLSRGWHTFTGQTAADGLGFGWLGAVHPDDREQAGRTFRAATERREAFALEHRLRRADGQYRWVIDAGRPRLSDAGEFLGFVGSVIDIDGRKRAEQALRASERRYRLVVESQSEMVCRFRVDGEILFANAAYARGVGSTPDAMLGRNFWEFIPPAEHAAVRATLARLTRAAPEVRIENRFGAGADARWTLWTNRALAFDADGRATEAQSAGIDITDRKRAEEEVAHVTAASERRKRLYETALNNTPDLVYVFDLNHRFTYANDALLRTWGRTWDEAIGKTCLELGYPDWHAARHDAEIEQVRATRAPVRGEVPFTGTAGRRVYDYIFVPVIGATGEVEAVAGTTRDVTDRQAMEQQLRDSREFLDSITGVAPTMLYVYDLAETRTVWVNRSVAAVLGYTAAEVSDLGANVLPALMHPADAARYADHFAHLRRLADGVTAEFEYRMRHRDGGWRWLVSREMAYERDAGGAVTRIVGAALDVTDRRQAESEVTRLNTDLNRRVRELQAVFDAAPVGINVATDAACRDIRGNRALAEMVGMTADQNVSKSGPDADRLPYRILRGGREVPADELPMQRAARLGAAVVGEMYEVVRADGSRLNAMINAVPVRDADGSVTGAVGVCTDVTALRAAEEQLRQADRRKDDFLALLAHELRNPLAPLRNGLQVLRLAPPGAAAAAAARDMMDRQLGHMVRLIDDLLDVSRISRNKMELRRTRLLLADVVNTAVETVRPAVDAARHELVVALPDDPVCLDADLTRLAQVFGNLLGNSAKYTPPGGRIRLTASAQGDQVVVTVSDTGVGIPAVALPTVFDMFTQVDRSIEKNTGGLGIGLALVKGLVEMHGGTVSADSGGPGQGSTFTVRLPVARPAPPPAGATRNGVPPAAPGGRRILVVDDNQDSAESMAEMLQLLGNDTAVAHDGLQAVEAAERVRPDVILMDVGMPRLNGYDATRRIRATDWGRRVRIIALTGWGQDGDRVRSREAGCDGHLVKPVDLADLQLMLTGRPADVA